MADPRQIQRCRWAEPTLFLPNPYWLAAEDSPWSCGIDPEPRPIEDTEACRTCARCVPVKPRIRLTRRAQRG